MAGKVLAGERQGWSRPSWSTREVWGTEETVVFAAPLHGKGEQALANRGGSRARGQR